MCIYDLYPSSQLTQNFKQGEGKEKNYDMFHSQTYSVGTSRSAERLFLPDSQQVAAVEQHSNGAGARAAEDDDTLTSALLHVR